MKLKIKYYKPRYPIALVLTGEHITFRWHKKWKVIGKTKKGYLKLREVK